MAKRTKSFKKTKSFMKKWQGQISKAAKEAATSAATAAAESMMKTIMKSFEKNNRPVQRRKNAKARKSAVRKKKT